MRPKGRKAGREVRLEEPDGKIYSDSLGEAVQGGRKDKKKRWSKIRAWTLIVLNFFFFALEFCVLRFDLRNLEEEMEGRGRRREGGRGGRRGRGRREGGRD